LRILLPEKVSDALEQVFHAQQRAYAFVQRVFVDDHRCAPLGEFWEGGFWAAAILAQKLPECLAPG
jgi:hypothetical protein